jgi:hypothetical protein
LFEVDSTTDEEAEGLAVITLEYGGELAPKEYCRKQRKDDQEQRTIVAQRYRNKRHVKNPPI